jgi:hypothetical protein
MQHLLLRIGADMGTGGGLSPIYKDGTFDLVPIPEAEGTTEDRTYQEMAGRDGRSLAGFVSEEYRSSPPHIDPEFGTYTYGDPTQKRTQLARLQEDDLLVFYAGLRPYDYQDSPRLFVVGYFTVDAVHDLEEMSVAERRSVLDRLENNAHAKRTETTPDSKNPNKDAFPVIVEGKPDESRLLDRARPLSDAFVSRTNPQYHMLPHVAALTGYSEDKDLTRATGRWLTPPDEAKFREWLDDGTVGLVDDKTTLRTYVLRHDSGFALNTAGGFCTLATCKPDIRLTANVGDWVVGTGARTKGGEDEQLLYAMRVEETLTYDEYFQSQEFQFKKPLEGELYEENGDNIYYTATPMGGEEYDGGDGRTYFEIGLPTGEKAYTAEDTPFIQLKNPNHGPARISKDTRDSPGRTAVLVSRQFWYFGADEVHLPEDEEMRGAVIKGYPGPNGKQGHKNAREQDRTEDFVRWLVENYRPGIHGPPRDQGSNEEHDQHTSC